MAVTALQSAENVFDRCADVMQNAPSLPLQARQDVYRLCHALAVSGLDTYCHQLVRTKVDGRTTVPSAFDRDPVLRLRFEDLAAMGRTSVSARRAGVNDRPMTRFRNAVHQAFLRKPLVSLDDVQAVVRFVGGSPQNWSLVWTALQTTKPQAQRRLDAIVMHRNQIVHEGDQRRLVRPRNITLNQVDRRAVLDDLAWLRDFVLKVDTYLV